MLNRLLRNWFSPTLGQTSESRRQQLAPKKLKSRRRLFVEELEPRVTPSNSGHGELAMPSGSLAGTGFVFNPTHWSVQEFDHITDTIVDATDIGSLPHSGDANSGTIDVFIKSSMFGNTTLTGTYSGTTITFTWTAEGPQGDDLCGTTTNVAYGVVGNDTNNFLISGGTATAGLAVVGEGGGANGNFGECTGMNTFDTSITTSAYPTDGVVGNVTLNDTATLTGTTGAPTPGGTITFQLIAPDSTVVYTDVVPVTGFGTYDTGTQGSTPGGALAGQVGTYEWSASYSGDTSGNNGSDSAPGSEPVTIDKFDVHQPGHFFTTPSATAITLGTTAPTLTDTASLSGNQAPGFTPTGSITFTLIAPDGTTVLDTETVPVNGNMDYTTPNGFTLPTNSTVVGTYQWNATYSGDANNTDAEDIGNSNEQVLVSPAKPSIVTTASPGITLDASGAPTITDSIVMSGAYFPTGSVNVTLMLGSTTVKTDSFAAANGTVTESYTLPTSGTVAGTYTWSVTYAGDGNNNGAVDEGGTAEQTVVSPAQPALVTNAALVKHSQSITLTDSATLSGGYSPTGSIHFTLTMPDNSVFDDGSVTVTGNGTYAAAPVTASLIGTYTWHATYSGDGNNLTATDNGVNESVTITTTGNSADKTLGYWGNTNGQLQLTGSKTGTTVSTAVWTALFGAGGALNKDGTNSVLVNGSGVYQTDAYFKTYANLKSFLNNATATNMAYMLSAQLLTTELNVYYGYVSTSTEIYVPNVTVVGSGEHISTAVGDSAAKAYAQLVANGDGSFVQVGTILSQSIAELKAAPNTVTSSNARAYEEGLKDLLDAINNGENIFVI